MARNTTSYITPASSSAKIQKRLFSSLILSFLATIIAFVSVVGGVTALNAKKAEAVDWSQWIMCSILPEPANLIYQWTQTSDLQFLTRSKSAVSSGVDDVDSGFNWLLSVSGEDFNSVNQNIVGYNLDPEGIEEALTESEYAARYNKGTYVNPFDRFGIAGMKFTGYMGEWKYFVVDACSSGGEPKDPQAGLFYEKRLEPRSTWDDKANSPDIRTQQFNKGILSQYSISVGNTVSNWIFNVTKAIVAITLAFINFAFSDISDVMGLTDLIGGDGGVFKSLFSGVFMPLVFLAFVLTAGYIFYVGIVKRQYRTALTSVIRSLVLFFAAIVVAANPAFFISLPNNASVVIQSVMLTSMNSTITGGDQICATDIGQTKSKIVTNTGSEDISILTQASKNIRSVVGCQFWQSFLLKPWSEGQFGADWNNLWANDKVPSWADSKTSGTLGNTNDSMVGDAEVPLGGGKVVNNWAIYQLSTQTSVHSPTGHPGERPRYTSAVANDWWRIVDALSNYAEEEANDNVTIGGNTTVVTYQKVSDTLVSPYWDSWVGNNMMQRVGAATTSIFVAGIGVSAPLVFAALSLIYTMGLAILMAFAPLMLLMGCWAPRGWEIFKGWGELVLNTTMKRIATGLMLTISVLFVSSIIKMSDSMAWWQVLVALILMSILLIKSRKTIIDAMASFRFATTNFGATASRMSENIKHKGIEPMKTSGKIAGSAAIGGIAAASSGGSFKKGLFAGANNEFKNVAYRNESLRNVITAYETEKSNNGGDILKGNVSCAICGKNLDYEDEQGGTGVFHGGRDSNGNLICNECLMDGVDPDAQEVVFYRNTAKERADKKRAKDEKQLKMYKAFQSKFKKNTVFNNEYSRRKINQIIGSVDENGIPTGTKYRETQLKELLKGVQLEISDHQKASEEKGAIMTATPEIPQEIRPYVDPNVLAQAWDEQQYDYIRMTYIAGFVAWYNDIADQQFEQSLDSVLEFVQSSKGREKLKDSDSKNGEEEVNIDE